jgi:peptidyl-tRNA hydrolase
MSQEPAAAAPAKRAPVICQYIFLRKDLEDWPAGAMATQAAHASVAAIVEATAAQHEATATYVNADNLKSMTKMVYAAENLGELERVREAWNALIRSTSKDADSTAAAEAQDGDCLQAYWWVEQPENIPTAMATWPIVRTNKVSKVIKNLKLDYF